MPHFGSFCRGQVIENFFRGRGVNLEDVSEKDVFGENQKQQTTIK
jgi:hypothetical protein